jgi:hypothetical protein
MKLVEWWVSQKVALKVDGKESLTADWKAG